MARLSAATPARAAAGWSRLPPAQRFAAAVLLLWIVAFPGLLAVLLAPDPAGDGPSRMPIARRAGNTAAATEAILQRPLFSRSRRPPPPPIMQAAPMPPPQPMRDRSLVVRGIVIRDGGAKAFVTAGGSPDGTWIAVGDRIGGWDVAAIEPHDVQLKGGNDTFMAVMNPLGGP